MNKNVVVSECLLYEIIALLEVLGNILFFTILQLNPLVFCHIESCNSLLNCQLLVHKVIHGCQDGRNSVHFQYLWF